jgi:hypothetical protein
MELIATWWRKFGVRAERVERQWPFDPLSYPIYAYIVATLVVEHCFLLATDFSLNLAKFLPTFFLVFWMAFSGPIARAYGHPKAALLLEACALPAIIGVLTGFASIMLSRISAPAPVDASLVTADRALGLDWLAWLEFYRRNPWVLWPSNFAYSSMFFQFALVPLVLFWSGRARRGWAMIGAWALAGALSCAVFPFFPTHGPFVYFGLPEGYLPDLKIRWPWQYGAVIDQVRAGVPVDIGQTMGGLIEFPSFHAAAAVIFSWAILPVRRLRWAVLALNIAMIAAIPIRGAHYFVDVLGGIAVAILAIGIANAFYTQLDKAQPPLD